MDRPSRAYIVDEIKRCAAGNDGKPLGRERFEVVTDIRESDWLGRYWVRWGDALQEAGFEPNILQGKVVSDDELVGLYAALAAELGRLPTEAEIRMKHRADPAFPSHGVFNERLGRRADRIARLAVYVQEHPEFEHLGPLLAGVYPGEVTAPKGSTARATGFVYLVRSGKHHKIGRSNDLGRRTYEIALQLPERLHLVHAIETDDPPGIERYWHERFAGKRANGEWFLLSAEDVAAFKARRRFM